MTETARPAPITFHIDGSPYRRAPGPINPAEIRRVPQPPIPDDKDVWLDIDDAQDRKLDEGEEVELTGDLHFFSEFPAVELVFDRASYVVYERKMTGAQLRTVPSPDVAPDRDLWLDVPDARDRKVQDEDVIVLKDGMRFFTAPGRINPGHSGAGALP
jgi:hypothetical protein